MEGKIASPFLSKQEGWVNRSFSFQSFKNRNPSENEADDYTRKQLRNKSPALFNCNHQGNLRGKCCSQSLRVGYWDVMSKPMCLLLTDCSWLTHSFTFTGGIRTFAKDCICFSLQGKQ